MYVVCCTSVPLLLIFDFSFMWWWLTVLNAESKARQFILVLLVDQKDRGYGAYWLWCMLKNCIFLHWKNILPVIGQQTSRQLLHWFTLTNTHLQLIYRAAHLNILHLLVCISNMPGTICTNTNARISCKHVQVGYILKHPISANPWNCGNVCK